MKIDPGLAADFVLLNESLDGGDIEGTLAGLVTNLRLAVPSYLGLTITIAGRAPPFVMTTMEDSALTDSVRSSVLIPLTPPDPVGTVPAATLVLYAARAGTFVDLAADLSWLSAFPLDDYVIDQHLRTPEAQHPEHSVRAASMINQAIGVLIGRGFHPGEAHDELDARAARSGISREAAAIVVLASLEPPHDDDGDDADLEAG